MTTILRSLLIAIIFMVSACSHYTSPLLDDPYALPTIEDPREEANRKVLESSLEANRGSMGEAAKGYKKLPTFLRERIRDFSTNLNEPENFIASLLQGKGEKALRSLMRFILNSTLGIFGLIDIASSAGVKPAGEDMGQVLATWGWSEGIYLVLPLVGPTTSRDFFGSILGLPLRPTTLLGLILQGPFLALALEEPVSTFTNYLENADTIAKIEKGTIDPYTSFKSYYLNRRHLLITDEIE